MAECRVCGRDFDARGFQIVVPGLGQGFDRVECAEAAVGLARPPVGAAADVQPRAAAAPPVQAAPTAIVARRPLLVGGQLALLGAGTAATVYLWLRVFGVDPSSVNLPAEAAARAWEQATVPAEMAPTPAGEPRRRETAPVSRTSPAGSAGEPEPPAAAAGEPAPTLVSSGAPPAPASGDGVAAPGGSGGGGERGGGRAVAPTPQPRPDSDPVPTQPRPATPPAEEPGTGRGGSPGKAKGHDKPEHDRDHGKSHESGNGKKTGHGKHH